MPDLLCISPHLPPTNAPDHQRVRQSLPYWEKLGWSVSVIGVEAAQVAAPQDPLLAAAIPERIPITRVRARSLAWSIIPGFGTLGYRCKSAIWRAIDEYFLKRTHSDPVLVYFSTTQFPVLQIIPQLRRRWPQAVVVVDYQDPWVNDYYIQHPDMPPPGGRLKYGIVQHLARRSEPKVLRSVAGITTVSTQYRTAICQRNPWFESTPWIELTFGGAKADFDQILPLVPAQKHFDKRDGLMHWVYVGRGGKDLELAARGLFRALRMARESNESARKIRLHFLGTDYAPPARARRTLWPIAESEGVGDAVHEEPVRLPYGEALRCMADAHAIVVPGSADPGYSASKIYPCILAERPLLAIFHHQSPVHRVMSETHAGVALGFDAQSSVDTIADQILKQWISSEAHHTIPPTDWAAFQQYTDEAMTERLSLFFTPLLAR